VRLELDTFWTDCTVKRQEKLKYIVHIARISVTLIRVAFIRDEDNCEASGGLSAGRGSLYLSRSLGIIGSFCVGVT